MPSVGVTIQARERETREWNRAVRLSAKGQGGVFCSRFSEFLKEGPL